MDRRNGMQDAATRAPHRHLARRAVAPITQCARAPSEDIMKGTRWVGMVATMLTLFVSACASNGALREDGWSRDEKTSSGSVAVLVTNNNYADMKVYAIVGGSVPVRLGTVVGGSSTRFTAHHTLFPTGQLRLVASETGGRNLADSGLLEVSDGQSVTFTIQPHTVTSFAVVR
jgi:hypothetical protein